MTKLRVLSSETIRSNRDDKRLNMNRREFLRRVPLIAGATMLTASSSIVIQAADVVGTQSGVRSPLMFGNAHLHTRTLVVTSDSEARQIPE